MELSEKISAILAATKLSQGEFAVAIGVSRVIVNKYVRGKVPAPRAKMLANIEKTVVVLEGLVARGKLPLSTEYTKDQRINAAKKIRAFVVAS